MDKKSSGYTGYVEQYPALANEPIYVLNPIDILEKYGTDALRFAVSTGTSPGNDSKLTAVKLESGRNFANKLWNATRFVLRSIEPGRTTRSPRHVVPGRRRLAEASSACRRPRSKPMTA